MCNGASRDADIEQDNEITQPKSRAHSGRVLEGFWYREFMRLFGKFFDGVRRRGRLFRPRPRTGKPHLAKPLRHSVPPTHPSTEQALTGAKAASTVREPR